MGISTVSGPFRSKNGFQELVNGEWVPVAGGGGGGGAEVLINWGDSITLPTPTALGQVYNINVAYQYDEINGLSPVNIELPVIGNGYDSVSILTGYVTDPSQSPVFGSDVQFDTGGSISIVPGVPVAYASIKFVYAGLFTSGGQTFNIFQGFLYLFRVSNPG